MNGAPEFLGDQLLSDVHNGRSSVSGVLPGVPGFG
jgi:hypothetical protein